MTTTPESTAKAAVREALDSVKSAFPDCGLAAHADGQGGLWVELTGVPLGNPYQQADTFVVFLLPFTLPGSDIYPMFIRRDLSRIDGQPLGEGFQATELSWPAENSPRPVVQVSRRTRGAFASQTAQQKIVKVLDWIRTR